MAINFTHIIVAASLTLLLSNYLQIETPLTTEVLQWKKRGNYFKYGPQDIFYIESINEIIDDKKIETIILLHGFPSFSYDWKKIWTELSVISNRVLSLDFIGFGLSDKPKDINYSIFQQADIVENLIEKLKLKNVHLLAHDYGDTIAQELLYRFNNKITKSKDWKIKSVCLSNGGIFPETNFPRLSQKVLRIPYIGQLLSKLMFYYAFKHGFSQVFGSQTQPTDKEFQNYWSAITYNGGESIAYKLLNYIDERWQNRQRWVDGLLYANVQIHVIYGPADPVNPPNFIIHFKKIIPNATITVLKDHISHYPQVEDPKGFYKAYEQFIKSTSLKKLFI